MYPVIKLQGDKFCHVHTGTNAHWNNDDNQRSVVAPIDPHKSFNICHIVIKLLACITTCRCCDYFFVLNANLVEVQMEHTEQRKVANSTKHDFWLESKPECKSGKIKL